MTAGRLRAAGSSPRFVDPPWRFRWPVAVVFFGLCLLLSYPGRLNADTLFAVVAAAKPGLTNNWHSATLTWFWGLLGPLLGQPLGALVMQALLFGLFAGFLPQLPATPRGRSALAGELLLRIVLAGAAGYLGKDGVMLLALLMAVQLLRGLPQRPLGTSGAILLVTIIAVFLLAKAPNFLVIVVAIALVLPFLVRSARSYVGLAAAALALGALAVPLNRLVDAHIFGARDLHPDKQIVLFDLAGISVNTGRNAFASAPGWPNATLPSPQSCYLPYMWDSFAHWAPCGGYANAYDRLDHVMVRHWLGQVAAHPVAYLQHRATYTRYLLQSQDHATWGLAGRAVNDASNPEALAEMRRGLTDLQADTPIALWQPSSATTLFRWAETVLLRFYKVQWAGLIICLAVLVFSWLRRSEGIRLGAIVAAALGVGNVAMLAVFGVADPGRYMLPTVGLAYVALLALLAPAERAQASASAPIV